MNPVYKKIYKKIKEFDTIVIARHISPDPDAICSQLSLRDSIKLTFPKKKVLAVGTGVARFKSYGLLDKLESVDFDNTLLIILDCPTADRIDILEINKFKNVVKIDHHPFEEMVGEVEYINDTASSTAELIMEIIFNTKLKLNESIAENLFLGVVSDSDRFLLSYTSAHTFELIAKLLKLYPINIAKLYKTLYERPLSEIRFHAYLSTNLKVSENGFGYLMIPDEVFKEYGVDNATASNMVNDFNFIKEVVAWMFIRYDEKNEIYKMNIRSNGPVINEVAMKYNGGGHKFASGIRTENKELIDNIIKDLDDECRKYKESNSEIK